MRLVLDASVAIKFYIPEDQTERAIAWLARDVSFVAPDIFLVEVAQALLRHSRDGRLQWQDLVAATEHLGAVVDVPFASSRLVASALGFAHRLDHRLHDCMYLALAERLDAPLLTADGRLVRKVRERLPAFSILSLDDPLP